MFSFIRNLFHKEEEYFMNREQQLKNGLARFKAEVEFMETIPENEGQEFKQWWFATMATLKGQIAAIEHELGINQPTDKKENK